MGDFGPPPILLLRGGFMPAGVENIVKALKEDNPSWPLSKVYAIAWSSYKKKGGNND